MENDFIRFRKRRELGDIITDTFRFTKKNYRGLSWQIYKNVTLPFLLLIAALSYYTSAVAGNSLNFEEGMVNFPTVPFLILILTLVLFYAALYSTVMHYIKSYIQNDGEISASEVKEGFNEDFSNVSLLLLLIGIIVFAGLVFFVIPGIYLLIPLSLAPAIFIFDRYKITECVTHCFHLVRDHWWMTFFTMLIIWLLVYLIALIFQLPIIIYMFIELYTGSQEVSATDPESYSGWVFISLNVLASLIQYLLSTVSIIGVTFIYFNLNEHKSFSDTYDGIEDKPE